MILEATNPRILIISRVLLCICQLLPEDAWAMGAASKQSCFPSNANRLSNIYTNDGSKRKVDSFTNVDKTYFVKTHVNEIYPETILIYRDKEGPADQRTSRITELSKRYINKSFIVI